MLRVRRKGGKIQALALPAPAAARIDAYLAGRDDVTMLPAIPGSPAAPRRRVLFATGTGARMYRADGTLLCRLGRAAGLPGSLAATLSPHSMRHAFATLNLDAGGSLRDLQVPSAEPVELRDDKDVAGAQVAERGGQALALRGGG